MILGQLKKAHYPFKKTLLFDFAIPLLLVALATYFLDRNFSRPVLQYIIDFPILGVFFYKSPLLAQYIHWHFLLFSIPFLFFSFGISFRTARIPGPGRAVRRFYQWLLIRKHQEDDPTDSFPPAFNRQDPKIQKWIARFEAASPQSVVLGVFKRFGSDLARDKRAGMKVEKANSHLLFALSPAQRYRHLQVVGNTGCGKTASILAPILLHDAATPKMATVTLNPKADIYPLKVLATGARKGPPEMPTALLSFGRKESLAYDPLLYGDADMLTKKLMYAFDFESEHYRAVQESWLLNFFHLMRTEPELNGKIMLKQLHEFLTNPSALIPRVQHLLKHPDNLRDLKTLATTPTKSLSGLAANVGRLVKDESLSHIFKNPTGRFLNVKEVIQKGGNIFLDLTAATKGPQAHALGRMILMELQLLVSDRQAGTESSAVGVQCLIDEFGSFAYTGIINMLDKCRSARFGFVLCHQTVDNLERKALGPSFKGEVVDNTLQKLFLQTNAETAEWASKILGERPVIKTTVALGQTTDKTNIHGRDNQTVTYREELTPYVLPSDFTVGKGYGFGVVEHEDTLIKAMLRLGYIHEKELCSDAELTAFLEKAWEAHAPRPLGSLLLTDGKDKSPENPKSADENNAPKEKSSDKGEKDTQGQDKKEDNNKKNPPRHDLSGLG